MAFRRRNYEFEADLYKVPTSWLFRREMGELERTSYEDGEERLKISVRGLEVEIRFLGKPVPAGVFKRD